MLFECSLQLRHGSFEFQNATPIDINNAIANVKRSLSQTARFSMRNIDLKRERDRRKWRVVSTSESNFMFRAFDSETEMRTG